MNQKEINREDIVKNIKSEYLIIDKNGIEHKINLENKEDAIQILDQINDSNLKSYVLSEEMKLPTKQRTSIN